MRALGALLNVDKRPLFNIHPLRHVALTRADLSEGAARAHNPEFCRAGFYIGPARAGEYAATSTRSAAHETCA
jgi:hypothetical protein